MITFKPIIIPGNKRKDGTYPVNIRVTYNGKVRRLPTTLVARPTDLTRSLKLKSADIISKADELISRMRKSISNVTFFELEGKDIDWVVDKIKSDLTEDSFSLDFFVFADTFLKTKKDGTRNCYNAALNYFAYFIGKRELDINTITRKMILDFMEMIDTSKKLTQNGREGLRQGTTRKKNKGRSRRIVSLLSCIYDAAKAKYNDEDSGVVLIPRSPFNTIPKELPPSKGQRSLGVELMQHILNDPAEGKMRIALDLFIASFGLMGANMADLYFATPPSKGIWAYSRQKTKDKRADNAAMRVYIPEQITPVLARLKKNGDWMGVLHEISIDKDRCTGFVNRFLKKWCKDNDVETFTFYAARHTWATLARKAGVEKATIDECLCHVGDFDMADIYAERDWDIINDANKKVLALFEWKRVG